MKLGQSSSKDILIIIEADDPRVKDKTFDLTDFLGLGYSTLKNREKHYRMLIEGELENSTFMGKDIFFTLDISRGKQVENKKKNFLQRIFGSKSSKHRKVGKFRGIIEVIEDKTIKKIENLGIPDIVLGEYHIPHNIKHFKHNDLDKQILRTVDVFIRIYVIDAQFYTSMDLIGENDSYLIVEMDKTVIKDSKRIMDRNNPKYFSVFEFKRSLPGPSDVKVKFYDYDFMTSDDFIGETIIDVERIFFDARWRSFKNHPIETRLIYHPSSSIEVGTCRMFVEVYENQENMPKKRLISPRPPSDIEIRIIVWELWDVPPQDIEGVSDLYVKVKLPSYHMSMKTDTHYRAQGGFGSFNWRIKFNVTIDEYFTPDMAEIQFSLYDRDLLSSNDYISSTSINIANLIEETLYKESRKKYKENGSYKFFKDTIMKNGSDENEVKPKILLSIDCLTMKEAKVSPAGIGRGDPNQDPHLEPPKGRFQWTLNPLKLFEQTVGPQFKRKAYLICCLVFCVLLMIIMLPLLLSEVVASAFTKFLGM